jgi:hypothetical protein
MNYNQKYTQKHIKLSTSSLEEYFSVSDTVECYASKINKHNYEAKGKMSRKLAQYSNLIDSVFSSPGVAL